MMTVFSALAVSTNEKESKSSSALLMDSKRTLRDPSRVNGTRANFEEMGNLDTGTLISSQMPKDRGNEVDLA